jgi:hypothetical protein
MVCCQQTFDFQVVNLARDRFTVQITLIGGGEANEGWRQDLQMSWIAQPQTSAKDHENGGAAVDAASEMLDSLEYLKGVDLPYGNLPGMPVHLPPVTSLNKV